MDMSHYTDFVMKIPFLGFWGLFSNFLLPKLYFFLFDIKFSIDGYVTRPYDFGVKIPFLGSWAYF
jgi:hypothetical protein